MSAILCVVCVVASVTSLNADIETLTTGLSSDAGADKYPVVKHKNFVEIIKANLRRNNDDYATGDRLDEAHRITVKTRRKFNDSETIAANEIVPDNTIVHKISNVPETEITSVKPSVESTLFRSGAKEFVRKKKHEHHSTRKHNMHTDKPTTKSIMNEVDRKAPVDKWKHLIEKSNRLRMYTSSPKIEPSVAPPAVMSRMRHAIRTAADDTVKEPKTTMTSASPARGATKPRPRLAPNIDLLPLRSPSPHRKIPSADQLDMAPARGAYIHDMRLKGKFCYRHVLWPEGPKYNSMGETIMPAFNASIYNGRRRFFETSKPQIVLPRCCNCCKKSVLGCQ